MEDKRKEVLDQVKLVPADNMLDSISCYVYLQDVIDEGIRSTFGMRVKDAIILRLANDLRVALELAAKSEELERKVKGLQLENGRLRKRESREQNEETGAENGADA